MIDGARIDLETSYKTLLGLTEISLRDLEAGELSDEAIGAVNTAIRSLEGALGKVANAIHAEFATRKATPYFPIARNPAEFPERLESNLPGVQASHPEIAEAIERQQPYHEGQEKLALLKQLYRENHHHNFTLQTRHEARSFDLTVGGKLLMALDSRGASIGGAPIWRGLCVKPTEVSIDIPEELFPKDEAAHVVMSYDKGLATVYINAEPVLQRRYEDSRAGSDWIDWHFAEIDASVLGTLLPLHNLCQKACEEVWVSTGL
jgi:hypothetical protein